MSFQYSNYCVQFEALQYKKDTELLRGLTERIRKEKKREKLMDQEKDSLILGEKKNLKALTTPTSRPVPRQSLSNAYLGPSLPL